MSSTVRDSDVRAPVTWKGLFTLNLVFEWSQVKVGIVPDDQAPNVKPAPSVAELVVAFLPTVIFKSATSKVVLLTVVVVPLTVKSPVTVKLSATVTSEVVCPIVIGTPLVSVAIFRVPVAFLI